MLVTAGGQAAIALVLAALVTPGDRVLVEHPTYPNALDAVHARGARCVPVPLDLGTAGADAWDLDLVTAAIRDAAPRLAYLVPDHQNPTGALLDGAGRERLVALARAHAARPLLIDETLAELTLAGPSERTGRRARRRRLAARDHDRVGGQGALGRPAHRLDPDGRAD